MSWFKNFIFIQIVFCIALGADKFMTDLQKIQTFDKLVKAGCKLKDQQKIKIIHSEFKCFTLINDQVDIRFSCKPNIVQMNLQKNADEQCALFTDDFTNETIIHSQTDKNNIKGKFDANKKNTH